MSNLSKPRNIGAVVFRAVLFLVASSLAAYIVYKYTFSLHAIEGAYAVLFPLSGILALAGMILAVKPSLCSCSLAMRSGIGGLSVIWMGTGMLCLATLGNLILASPLGGAFAMFHMVTQHVLLPLALIGFALAPAWMLSRLGNDWIKTSAPIRVVASSKKIPH